MGFYHTHMRSDRDKWLTIHKENIDILQAKQFGLLKPHQERIFTPFDYDSIMLYGSRAFSHEGKVTMSPTIPGVRIIDPRYKPGLSEYDAYSVNRLYNCTAIKTSAFML